MPLAETSNSGNSSQAGDQRIFNTVDTLDLMRTSTEFISEISAPTISTSFKFHLLDSLVNLGEVDAYHPLSRLAIDSSRCMKLIQIRPDFKLHTTI